MNSRDLAAINRAIDAVYLHESGATFLGIAEKLNISRKYARNLAISGASNAKIRAAVDQRKRHFKEKAAEGDGR